MKKEVIVLLLLGILLVSPLVLAQEQSQTQEQMKTYSGFDRFVDNVKMVFSFGDKKVMQALEIREKEINSAIVNTKNGDDENAEKNLERARKRLQFVQNKVSIDTAEDVGLSVDEIINDIEGEEDLPDSFDVYVLEEKKTRLTAELAIEIGGSEGQTQSQTQERTQTRTTEIAEEIMEIDTQIADTIETGMDVDLNKIDPNASPKTPIPTDGSICCKKTKDGETRYHWDYEEDCLNPEKIKGEVVDTDVCVALGQEVLDKEDPKSWGSVDGGVPKECVEQGAYDDESCEAIMAKLPVCCMHNTDGEITYSWDPRDSCVIGYGERMEDESLCA